MQHLWCCGRHCDHTARSSSPVVRFFAIQSDRVLDIPVVLTVQFLNKVVDMVFTTVPMVRTVRSVHRQGHRHPCSCSDVEVPQIQSSTELNDNREAKRVHFGASCAIFRTPPKGVESRVARIFRALDDEEFFVVEGSSGLAPTPGVHSQVLGRRV